MEAAAALAHHSWRQPFFSVAAGDSGDHGEDVDDPVKRAGEQRYDRALGRSRPGTSQSGILGVGGIRFDYSHYRRPV